VRPPLRGAATGARWGYFRRFDVWPMLNVASQSRSSARSTRYTPPVPAQLPLRPNEVTPPTTRLLPMKFGPPESPKQVPPVWALFDNRSEPSPVTPVLI
jgi:hypothetical protein